MTGATTEASHRQRPTPRAGAPRRPTVRAYVGLGSNVGDAAATLASAVTALSSLSGTRRRGVSSLHATRPVGVLDQPEFRNAVVALDVPAGPDRATGALDLLVALKELERSFGRQQRQRWGPRELDLDLLVFGRWHGHAERPADARSADPAKAALPLVVPHPEARRRLFVLAPLEELAPRLVPPGWGETVRTAAQRQRVVEGPNAVRVVGLWTGEGWGQAPRSRVASSVSAASPSRSSTR